MAFFRATQPRGLFSASRMFTMPVRHTAPVSASMPFTRYFSEISDMEKQRKRLVHQANNRGMKENDIILGTFAAKYIETLNQDELNQFDVICQEVDTDLWEYLTKKVEIPDHVNGSILTRLQDHAQSNPLNYQAE